MFSVMTRIPFQDIEAKQRFSYSLFFFSLAQDFFLAVKKKLQDYFFKYCFIYCGKRKTLF